jgi:DhnA family fructose-bisphosphate aldolase class Ia
VGRNIFQHEDPTALVRALDAIVHHDVPAEEAATMLAQ